MTNVGVYGLWHLGCVTAACVADAGYRTFGIDPYPTVVAGLKVGCAPLFEPGLDDLIRSGIKRSNLACSSDLGDAASCDLVWVTLDTPVDNNDVADVGSVNLAIEKLFPHLKDDAVLLIIRTASSRKYARHGGGPSARDFRKRVVNLPIRQKICNSARRLRFSKIRSASS